MNNTSGTGNSAVGEAALFGNSTGNDNIAIGNNALNSSTTGSANIALGLNAGANVSTANNVICIGAIGSDESNSCFIGNIFDQTSSGGAAVFVNAQGKLGTITSSRRFKDGIRPMDGASDVLFALKPVTFHYKADSERTPQFGLVAEEVAQVNPDLVVRDKEGKPHTVRYDVVNAMLLNEFLKEHRKNEQQEETIKQLKSSAAEEQALVARQREEIKALAGQLKEQAAQIQKVSAQVLVSKVSPQTVSEWSATER